MTLIAKESMPSRAVTPVYIHSCGFHSALGFAPETIHQRLAQGTSPDMQTVTDWLNNGAETVVGRVSAALPSLPEQLDPVRYNTRNNRLALSALNTMTPVIEQAIEKYGRDRIAVIVGTSTSGIADGETALQTHMAQARLRLTSTINSRKWAILVSSLLICMPSMGRCIPSRPRVPPVVVCSCLPSVC
ncbi:3-oxoacyl-[ACP] synthase FabV like [Photobacterium aphoticum]|uniref:3-oxoacyl-[ACP] synthase FabV like n=1 Tax=Photobacterium aphoticum TaxID=754436 RepID=A0A090QKX7_9GAMM|nr:3-oxoacyl-[ACP] synthase FabV like [Photobacterium aphoticum]